MVFRRCLILNQAHSNSENGHGCKSYSENKRDMSYEDPGSNNDCMAVVAICASISFK